jgi:arylsulfatase A-like enzyme
MAWPGPAPTWRCLAEGASIGAGAAAALMAGEVGTGLLLGAPFPPLAWAFHALYLVPGFTVAGAVGALFVRLSVVAAGLVWVPALAYCVAILRQDLPVVRALAAPARLAALLGSAAVIAAAAWLTERTLARRHVGAVQAHLLRLALIPVMVAAAQAAGRLVDTRPVPAVLLLPVAVAAAAILAQGALAPLAARISVRTAGAATAALLAAVALSAAWNAGRPPPGTLRDGPQVPAPAAGAAAPPNVVLIVLDAVRASSLSCYGYERRTTPRIDAFAAGAVRFASATTVSTWSVPTHASLFTGLSAPQHGAGTAQRDARTGLPRPAALDDRFVTLAEALSRRGYATAGVSANPLVAPALGLAQGFRFFDVRPSPRAITPRYRTLLQRAQGLLPRAFLAEPLRSMFPSAVRSAEEITDQALAWLGRRPRGQPFLLFLNYMDAHTPFVPRPGFSGRWPGRSRRLPTYGLPGTADVMAGRRSLTAEESSHLRALYDDAVSYLDHHVGRLLAALDGEADRDNTWIVVTADHGEQLGEHGRLGHDCVLYPEVMRVPLIVRYPRGSAEAARHGASEGRPVQLTEVAPMLAGGSLGPRRGGPGDVRAMMAAVDCYCWRDHPQFHGRAARAVVEDGLYYLEEEGRPPVLFDVSDPGRPVVAARPDDARRLAQDLERWRAGLAVPSLAAVGGAAEREEALSALGYVQ